MTMRWTSTVFAAALLGLGHSALAAPTVFKLATLAPEGSEWMTGMREAAAEIKEATDGRVVIKLYGGGIMGNDKKVLRKMRIGQLHGGTFVSSGLAERFPDIQLYGLPLLFENMDEVDFVRERMDAYIQKGLREQGLVSFGLASGGFALFMSNGPVADIDDLRGQKVWVPEGDQISYDTMEALGLAPVTLPITDVLTGLQTSLVDIIGSSPVGALVLQWHTKVKYMTDLPLSYLFGLLVIEEKAFNRLSPADQEVFTKIMTATYDRFETVNRTDDEKAYQALVKSGVELVEPEAGEVPEWRARIATLRQRLADQGAVSADKLAEIDALLAEFRTTRAADIKADP